MSVQIRRIVVARLAHPTNRPRSSGIASRRPERLDSPPFRHCAVTLPVRIRAPWGFKRDFVFRPRGPNADRRLTEPDRTPFHSLQSQEGIRARATCTGIVICYQLLGRTGTGTIVSYRGRSRRASSHPRGDPASNHKYSAHTVAARRNPVPVSSWVSSPGVFEPVSF